MTNEIERPTQLSDAYSRLTAKPLPKFTRPPVVETVLGVQFERLRGFTSGHQGLFWRTLGEDWTSTSDAPEIEEQREDFDEQLMWQPGTSLRIAPPGPSRLQIRRSSGDRMIQVQSNRLHYNWRRTPGDDYPHYAPEIAPAFEEIFQRFNDFVATNHLPQVQPNQWEITYVNHIPCGSLWNSPLDWSDIFPGLLSSPTTAPEVAFESLGGQWHFQIGPALGRLHVEIQHGKAKDQSEQLVATLTARGAVADPSSPVASVRQGLDLGRASIVRTFADLTSVHAHREWGRVQ